MPWFIPVIVAACYAGTHGQVFNHNAWSSFDWRSAAVSGFSAAVGNFAYSAAIGAELGVSGSLVASGMAAGATQGGLQAAANGQNMSMGVAQGFGRGGFSSVLSAVAYAALPPMNDQLSANMNPLTNSLGAYVSDYAFNGDSKSATAAARDSFYLSFGSRLTEAAYWQLNPPKSGTFQVSFPLRAPNGGLAPRFFRTLLNIIGGGHSAIADMDSGVTKELFPERSIGVARERQPDSDLNSFKRVGTPFGTRYDPVKINFSNVAVPSGGRNFIFTSDNCNSWTFGDALGIKH
jgi:hypothetical protein